MKQTGFSLPSVMLFLFLAVFFFLSACEKMPRGNAADGGRWFRLNRCNGCHGEGGTGGRGPVLASTKVSFRTFTRKLRSPKSAIMPTFGPEQLSDQDAADIYLWLLMQKPETRIQNLEPRTFESRLVGKP